MSSVEIHHPLMFGFEEIDSINKKRIILNELYPENIRHFCFIKSIKIWFGRPPEETKKITSLLGIQVLFLNYFTGEKKLSEYHGAQLTDSNIETKTLNVSEDDYLSKMYLGYDEYITHLKFETKNGDFIEFGTIDEKFEKNTVKDINEGRNIIINIRFYKTLKGIRMIGVDYLSYKKYFFSRLIDLFRLRYRINHSEKDKYLDPNEVNKLSYEMKCALRICQLPDTHFACIIKYL